MEKWILMGLWLLTGSVYGEVYKWVDEHGRVQYSDQPMANAKPMNIDDKSGSRGIQTEKQRRQKRQKLLESFAEDRKEKNRKLAESRKKQQRLKKSCLRARDRLRQYQRASSLYNLDSQGNRITLSEKQREASTRQLQASIRRYCK